ncbi:MAG: AMP-binding protein [Gaiella sp.]
MPRATSAGGYDPSWAVPATFNFAQDAVDILARDRLRPALVHVAADGTVDACTFADVMRESLRWARLLIERAPTPGDRVVLALDPGLPWAAAILGALRIGALPVPVGVRLDAEGLAVRALQVDPALIVAERRTAAAAMAAAQQLPERPPVLMLEEAQWELVRVGSPTPPASRPVSSPALILFTAGRTTGRPRPVVHTHAATFAAYVPARDWLDAQQGDRVLCQADGGSALALWHGLFGPWSAGAEILSIDGDIVGEERLELLQRFPPSVVVQGPAAHAALLDQLEEHELPLERLRRAASTGGRLSLALRRRFRKTTGVELLDGYTTAETGTVVFQPVDARARPGSVGLPAAGHVVAPIDDDGYVVPVGVMGDLAVYGRPPSLCAGYWTGTLPQDDRSGNWWTVTGDRAAFDENGSLWLDKKRPGQTAATQSGERQAELDEELVDEVADLVDDANGQRARGTAGAA